MLPIAFVVMLLAPSEPADLSAETQRAIDFLGPSIVLADGREINASVRFWHEVVGVPFARDVELVIPRTPLDLDLDGEHDVMFEANWSLPGGILANPRLVGLAPTPSDPKGHVGRTSISTGFLGVREEMDPSTQRGTGRYGFNCWLCHGSTNDRGEINLGVPNRNIYLGLIMAASQALDPDHIITTVPGGPPITAKAMRRRTGLDETFVFNADGDDRITVKAWRAAMNLPDAQVTRSFLMLAGPGRLDQSVDERLGRSVPLANHHLYMLSKIGRDKHFHYARMPKRSAFNPVSVPQNLSGIGVAHYSWTGKDSSMRHDAVGIITEKMGTTPEALANLIGFSFSGKTVDYEALSRALSLDFRNVGTMALEADNPHGQDWAYEVMHRPSVDLLTTTPARFRARELRDLLTRPRPKAVVPRDNMLLAKGRRIFVERVVGEIINQRVLLGRETRVPDQQRGIAVIAPLDRSKPVSAKVPVRCATCHNYSPLARRLPIETPLNEFQRCDLCHFDHPKSPGSQPFMALDAYMARDGISAFEGCLRCHKRHPDFGRQVYSNSWLLPFDADGDGVTHGDERDDGLFGGIGTDAHLNIESLFVDQLRPRRPKNMYLITENHRAVPPQSRFSSQGLGWVRVAPLLFVGDSAPYLHNGSVPTLHALLSVANERLAKFSVGFPEQRFELDTSLPGNSNLGHEFGKNLTREEKAAVVHYLESL